MTQNVGQWWSSVQQLRSELRLLNLRYPTAYRVDETNTLHSSTAMVLPETRSKVKLNFSITTDMLSTWPFSVSALGVDIEVVYGNVE